MVKYMLSLLFLIIEPKNGDSNAPQMQDIDSEWLEKFPDILESRRKFFKPLWINKLRLRSISIAVFRLKNQVKWWHEYSIKKMVVLRYLETIL